MKLVRFEITEGEFAYINPDQVTSVRPYKRWGDKDDTPLPSTVINFSSDTGWIVPGEPEDVATVLALES